MFDDRLLTVARAAGAEWRRELVRTVRDAGDHVEIDGHIRTRMLIGADGAESVVRRALVGPNARREIAVAIRGRILLAGDAASLVNPVSGEGIYYAIVSGLEAGRAAVQDPPRAAARYRAALARQLHAHDRDAEITSLLIRYDTVLDAGLRAARQNQQAFDDLALLSLGTGVITARLAARMGRQLISTRSRAALSAITG